MATAITAGPTPSPIGAGGIRGAQKVTRADAGHTLTFGINDTFELQVTNPIISVNFNVPGVVAPLGNRSPGSNDPWIFVAQTAGTTDLSVNETFPVPACAHNNPPCNVMPPAQLIVHIVVRTADS